MNHLYICAYCGKKWTEDEAALLPQSDSTAPMPICCGYPIFQQTWEGEELSDWISEAVAEAVGEKD